MEPKVTFDEDRGSSRQSNRQQYYGVTGLVMRLSGGVIKNPAQANLAMIILAILCITLSVILLKDDKDGLEDYEPPAGYRMVTPPNQPPRLEKI